MADFILNSTWQFVGVVIAFVSLWIPLIVYVMENRKKSLAYSILLSFKLSSTSTAENTQTEYVTLVRIYNNGKIPIRSDDFEEPIYFKANQTKITDIEVVETKPVSLNPKVKLKLGGFTLSPILLNSSDMLLLKIISNKEIFQLDCQVRLVGVDDIKSSPNVYTRFYVVSAVLIYVGLLLIGPMFIALILGKISADFSLVFIGPGTLIMIAGEILIIVRTIYSNFKIPKDKRNYAMGASQKQRSKKTNKR